MICPCPFPKVWTRTDQTRQKQDAVFIGSDCIDSYFDALSAHWFLCNCSLECSLTADLFLTDCIKIWARMMKIDCSRQPWTIQTDKTLAFLEHLLEPKTDTLDQTHWTLKTRLTLTLTHRTLTLWNLTHWTLKNCTQTLWTLTYWTLTLWTLTHGFLTHLTLTHWTLIYASLTQWNLTH